MTFQELIPELNDSQRKMLLRELLALVDNADKPRDGTSIWRSNQAWDTRQELKAEISQALTNYILEGKKVLQSDE